MLYIVVVKYRKLNYLNYEALRSICQILERHCTIIEDDNLRNSKLIHNLSIKENAILTIEAPCIWKTEAEEFKVLESVLYVDLK